ncbi:hypothetical protein [Rhabdothermincola sediminis]|uniref:hypothetical protein n=1 Tax=Rhabdothermincola sediminis TaxID=2751370 RepID=UPI001AA0A983|nr:hypothetical protein [Rhabdothermincola sediminis]
MPRRIEVELTSSRDDGTWTWRAAGAKQPKGELDGSLLYPGAKVGDVVRADAEFYVDGITVTAVLPPKEKSRKEPERIELIGPPRRDEALVTTRLARKGPRSERERGPRPGRDHERGAERRERRPRPERPAPEPRPKAPRLRPKRAHRQAVLASLPDEHKPIAEQVLRGGIPAVRQAVDKQNELNRAEGKPEINAEPLVAIAESLLPRLRAAEWRDRAEAALAAAGEVDLRDLRSVVVAAEQAARDDEARALAEQLRAALSERVEAEQAAWLAELDELLRDGRVVRALRLSSRPPKAGALLPPDLAERLAYAASGALTAETGQDRFATILDALAYAPVRTQVTAQSLPAKPSEELLGAVNRLAGRLPQIAAQFGVEPSTVPPRAKPARPPAPPPGEHPRP